MRGLTWYHITQLESINADHFIKLYLFFHWDKEISPSAIVEEFPFPCITVTNNLLLCCVKCDVKKTNQLQTYTGTVDLASFNGFSPEESLLQIAITFVVLMTVLLVKPVTNLGNAIMKPSDLVAPANTALSPVNGITYRLLYELKPMLHVLPQVCRM